MPPWQGGGEMIKEVHFEKTTYNELPFKFEAGTPDFIGVIGLGEAIRYVESLGLPEIAVYEQQLLDYAMERMRQVPAYADFWRSYTEIFRPVFLHWEKYIIPIQAYC